MTSTMTDGKICSSHCHTFRNWIGIWGAIRRYRIVCFAISVVSALKTSRLGAGAGFNRPGCTAAWHCRFRCGRRIDAVVSVVNGPAKLFRNVSPGESHWLAVRLRGRRANRQGLGASIHVHLADGRDLYNHATTAVGYACSSEALVRFGLGANLTVEKMEIHWPGGGVQQLSNIAGDRVVDVVEEVKP